MERYSIDQIKAALIDLTHLRDAIAAQHGGLEWALMLTHTIGMLKQLLDDEARLTETHTDPSFVPAVTPFDAPFDTEGRD